MYPGAKVSLTGKLLLGESGPLEFTVVFPAFSNSLEPVWLGGAESFLDVQVGSSVRWSESAGFQRGPAYPLLPNRDDTDLRVIGVETICLRLQDSVVRVQRLSCMDPEKERFFLLSGMDHDTPYLSHSGRFVGFPHQSLKSIEAATSLDAPEKYRAWTWALQGSIEVNPTDEGSLCPGKWLPVREEGSQRVETWIPPKGPEGRPWGASRWELVFSSGLLLEVRTFWDY